MRGAKKIAELLRNSHWQEDKLSKNGSGPRVNEQKIEIKSLY